jgi:hypothetical protein
MVLSTRVSQDECSAVPVTYRTQRLFHSHDHTMLTHIFQYLFRIACMDYLEP